MTCDRASETNHSHRTLPIENKFWRLMTQCWDSCQQSAVEEHSLRVALLAAGTLVTQPQHSSPLSVTGFTCTAHALSFQQCSANLQQYITPSTIPPPICQQCHVMELMMDGMVASVSISWWPRLCCYLTTLEICCRPLFQFNLTTVSWLCQLTVTESVQWEIKVLSCMNSCFTVKTSFKQIEIELLQWNFQSPVNKIKAVAICGGLGFAEQSVIVW